MAANTLNLRFTGGPIYLNSGSIGPDPYLFKTLPGGKWTRVEIRHKRPTTKAEYQADMAALSEILKHRAERDRKAVGDMAIRWYKHHDQIETVNAAEYWDRCVKAAEKAAGRDKGDQNG